MTQRTYAAEQIEAIGGRRWTKAGHDRVYINSDVWTQLIGLETVRYNSGNIAGATLNGEQISNARAKDIIGCISKIYWDAEDGQIHIFVYGGGRYADKVPTWIRDAIADKVAEQGSDDDTPQTPTGTATPDAPSTPDATGTVAMLRQAGRTVRQIAAALGCAISTVYRWARGIHRPSTRYAAALYALAA